MIVAIEKAGENPRLLVDNVEKVVMAEVTKVMTAINIISKYIQAISNTDINVTQDLGQTSIKKTRDILVKFKPKLIGYGQEAKNYNMLLLMTESYRKKNK